MRSVVGYYHRRLAGTAIFCHGTNVVIKDGGFGDKIFAAYLNRLFPPGQSHSVLWPECGRISKVENADKIFYAMFEYITECMKPGEFEVVADFGEVKDSCYDPITGFYNGKPRK